MLKEVYCFFNGFVMKDGYDCWDVDYLIYEIFKGFEKVKKMGIKDVELGIDIWVVDYVFVGENGYKLEDLISYCDKWIYNVI